MHARECEGEEDLGDEVPVAGRVERVGGDAAKPERLLQQDAVDWKARARERARAERQLGHAAPGVGEPLPVAHQGPGVRQQDVRPADGLRALSVRVTREDVVDPIAGAREQGASQGREVRVHLVDRVQGPKPEIGRDLVVARPPGVELPRDRPHLLVQQALDQRVDVFIGRAHGGAVRQPLRHAVQAFEQVRFLDGGEDADAAERVDPGLARRDVLRPQAVVHRQAAIQGIERFARPEGEPPAPHLVRRGFGRLVRGRGRGRGRGHG